LALNDIGDGGLMHSYALTLTADGKSAFFAATDKYAFGVGILKLTRTGPKEPWSRPIYLKVTNANGEATVGREPWINTDGTRLYFAANADGKESLFQAPLAAGAFGPAKLIGFEAQDRAPVLSRDEKRIYFGSSRPHPGGISGATVLVYTATRSGVDEPFGPVDFVTELNEGAMEMTPTWLSVDGCTIVLSGRYPDATTQADVYVATKPAP
jgi:Tol biopolymer transport system component